MRVLFFVLFTVLVSPVFSAQLSTFVNGSSTVNVSLITSGTSSAPSVSMAWNSQVTSADLNVYGGVLNVINETIGNGGSDDYIFSNIRNVFYNNYRVYVADNNRHRVMVYNTSNKQFLFQIGVTDTAGASTSLLDNPEDVFDNGTNIFVADRDNHRVTVYNYSGSYEYSIGTGVAGSGSDQFNNPVGLAIFNGFVYVADSANNRVKIHYLNGTFNYSFGSLGNGAYQFDNPTDVFVAPNGYLFVVDSNNQRVLVYDSSLLYVTTIGTTDTIGTGALLNFPNAISVSGTYIYVADTNNHRIAVFRLADYGYEQDIGVAGFPASNPSDTTNLNLPRGVTFDSTNVWIADSGLNRVVKTQGFYPSNVSLNVYGGSVDWQGSGSLSGTTSATLLASDINSFLVSCVRDASGNCTFPVTITSDSAGFIELRNLVINYNVIPISHVNGSNAGFDYYLGVSKGGVQVSGSPFHASPSYDFNLFQDAYNLSLSVNTATQTLGHAFYFINAQFSSDYFNQILLGNPATTAFTLPNRVPLLLSCVALSSISYESSNLYFSWSSVNPALIQDEANLTLYKCSSWDFGSNSCPASWSVVSYSKDTLYNQFNTSQTSATGCYAIVSESQATLGVNASLNQSSYNGGKLARVTGFVNSSAGVQVDSATVSYYLYSSGSVLYNSGYVLSASNGSYSFEFLTPQKTDTFQLLVTASKAGLVNNSVQKFFGITGCDTQVSLCLDSANCTSRGGTWCATNCRPYACDVECSNDYCGACEAESNCTSHGCYWCLGVCQGSVCGVCSSQTLGSCLNSDDCSKAGGLWKSSKCFAANETCSSLYPGLCLSSADCRNAGAEWCSGACKSLCASLDVEQLGANETGKGGEFDFRVRVTNDYDSDMVSTTVKVKGLDASMYSVKPAPLTLKPGKSQDFIVHIVIPGDKRLSDYDISYFVESIINGKLTTSLLNGFVQTIDLPPKVFTTFVILDDTVEAGGRVNFRVNLANARDTPVSVKLTYRIKSGNDTLAEKVEEIFLTNETTFAQTLLVPVTTFQGKYVLEILTGFGDKSSSEQSAFNVELARPWLIFIVLVFLGGLGLVYALKFRGRISQVGEIDEVYKDFDPKKLKKQ